MPPDFERWSLSHGLVIAFTLALAAALIVATRGRDWHSPRVSLLRGLVGGVIFCGFVVDNFWIVSNAGPDWADALPCYLCSWTFFLCGLALLSGWRWAVDASVYWGLTLTIQALITPDLGYGFPDAVFFLFFWGHALPVSVALWLWLGLQGIHRGLPRGAWWRSLLLFELWAAISFGLWRAFGTNYGYWNHKPEVPTALDWFGPWPWYLLVLQGLIALSWFLLSFVLERRRTPGAA